MTVRAQLEIARELVDPQLPLLLLRPVAADAMLAQEGFKGFRGADGTGEGKADGEGGCE